MNQKSGNRKRIFSVLLVIALCLTSVTIIPPSKAEAAATAYIDMVNVNASAYGDNDHATKTEMGAIGTTLINGHTYVEALFGTASWASTNPYVFSNGNTANIYRAAFDNSTSTYFDGRTEDGECGVKFKEPQYITRIGYRARQSTDRLNGAFFEGSVDGKTYDRLYTLDGSSTTATVYRTIANGLKADKAYQYFRVKSSGNAELNAFDIKLYTFNTTGNGDEVLNDLTLPTTIYSDKATLPSTFAGLPVTWVSTDTSVMDNSGNVKSGITRPATAKLTATLQWNASTTYTHDFTIAVESQTAVVNTAGTASVVYNGSRLNISTVSGLFTLGAGAGEATYTLEESAEATGQGTFAVEAGVPRLTVTKAGTFKFGLATAATESHLAGAKVVATLTVNKGTQTAPAAPRLPEYDPEFDNPEDDPVGTESISLRYTAGVEYGICPNPDNPESVISWQDSEIFTDLTPGTEYTFYMRKPGNDLYNPSLESIPLTVETYKKIVTNTAGTATVAYNNTIDLSTISGLFTVDAEAGLKTYTVEAEGTTGAGTIAPGTSTLTITKEGVFKIGLETAETATHKTGEKVIATLTVSKEITFKVTYDKNGATKGTVPTDATEYKANSQATVKDKGTLERTGGKFEGWTLDAKGTGKVYKANEKILITNANVTLYAKWTLNANKPKITKQPKAKPVTVGAKLKLKVKASATAIQKGSSKLSYQWFSNKKNSTKGGKKVKKATKATLTVPTNKKGTLYYYCKVTNKDSKATGVKSATAVSKRAKVVVK